MDGKYIRRCYNPDVVTSELTRRRILELALATQAAGIADAQEHAHKAVRARGGLEVLSRAEAADIGALTALIIPSGASPGAREAGAIYFIDRALATFDRDKRPAYREGLTMLATRRAELFPGSANMASLSAAQQLQLARSLETTEFFEMVRVHTILGFLAPPSYGGNRGQVGWRSIGFEE